MIHQYKMWLRITSREQSEVVSLEEKWSVNHCLLRRSCDWYDTFLCSSIFMWYAAAPLSARGWQYIFINTTSVTVCHTHVGKIGFEALVIAVMHSVLWYITHERLTDPTGFQMQLCFPHSHRRQGRMKKLCVNVTIYYFNIQSIVPGLCHINQQSTRGVCF